MYDDVHENVIASGKPVRFHKFGTFHPEPRISYKLEHSLGSILELLCHIIMPLVSALNMDKYANSKEISEISIKNKQSNCSKKNPKMQS